MTIVKITDMDTFVKIWGPRVVATLRRLGVRNGELLKDLEQEVYVRMMEKGTLECFDPVKGSFVTHVFQVIRTIAYNYHRASKKDIINIAESIEMRGEGDEEFLHPEVAKLIVEAEDTGPIEEFLELLYKELDKFEPWRSKSAHGETIKSLSMVCQLLMRGYKPKEIAHIFRVGPSSVSVWRKKIYDVACKIREEMGVRV